MYKGSLTVFAALTIMLVAQLIFVLLEGARYCEAGKVASIRGHEMAESAMAQFCKPLWDEYHLLGLDGSCTSEIIDDSVAEGGKNLLNAEIGSADIAGYTLLGDQAGEVYVAAVSQYMKKNFTYEEAQLIYSYYKSLMDIKDSGDFDEGLIDEAIDALSQKRTNNDLEDVKEIKATGLLGMILGDDSHVSSRKIHDDRVSKREIDTGTEAVTVSNDWFEKVLLCQYFSNHMSNYISCKNGHHLQYELEYIIGGRDNDRDNLESVAYQLLALREAANMLYLTTDSVRNKEALAAATAIAGISANPLVIEAVKLGIMAAWAYCESVMDLRTLFQGGRIPLMKSDATWTSGVTGMKELLSKGAKAKSVKSGLGYGEYTSVLLMFRGEGVEAYRAMDVQEATLRDIAGYETIRMDKMMETIRMNVSYSYEPIFGGLVNLIKGPEKEFSKNVEVTYSYYIEETQ